MNALTSNIQILHGPDGEPAYVVIPYADYMRTQREEEYLPHEVIARMVDNEWIAARAWREHLGLTLQQLAERVGISQAAYAQQEANRKISATNREKIAAALGIPVIQLEL